MDIRIGRETVEDLYSAGYIKNAADLYELKAADLLGLERWGDKSAQNLLESVEASKAVPFERVLYALGIRYVGETVAKRLARAFGSMEALQHATFEALMVTDEIGERIAQSVQAYFADPDNCAIVKRLSDYGLQMTLDPNLLPRSDKLKGLHIVISGTFAKHSRDEYKAMIEQHGGKNISAVSGKTDLLLAGSNIGPAKLDKALKAGVQIIGEDEFIKLLNA